MGSFDLSPSLYHGYVMEKTKQALSFDRRDPPGWQQSLRRKLKELTGCCGDGERAPLNVRRLWKREHGPGTVEKIVFTSEPRADVPAYVCIPGDAEPPYAFFICLQGHNTGMHNSIAVDADEAESIRVEKDRDFAIGCMKRGFGALCIEQRSFGERREKETGQQHPPGLGKCHNAAVHSLMLGKTLVGERVFDVDRGIDYLMTRGDVDGERIGVMGNSGGGTTSVYAAALLERLRYAMPSCSFGTFRDAKMAGCHCVCGYVPGILKYAEMHDVLGLFAPRPVVVVGGKRDGIVPEKSFRAGFEKLKEIYSAFGAGDRCHLVVGGEGHKFYPEAWDVMAPEVEGQRGDEI